MGGLIGRSQVDKLVDIVSVSCQSCSRKLRKRLSVSLIGLLFVLFVYFSFLQNLHVGRTLCVVVLLRNLFIYSLFFHKPRLCRGEEKRIESFFVTYDLPVVSLWRLVIL